MSDLFGSSGDNDEIVQPLPKGIRVSGTNTHPKILTQLPSNGIQWYKIAPRDYPSGQIRSDSYTKIYDRKYRPLKTAYKSDGDYIHVFEKQRPIQTNSFGGGGGSGGSSNSLDLCAMCGTSNGSQLNTDPAVFITIPKKDSTVERGVNGVEANGTAYDTKSIALSWASGSDSKDVSDDSWKTTLPLGVGKHELTAAVDGDTKSVKFSVVLKPALTAYTAEQIQELKTYTNNTKIREVEQNADTLAREAGLKETTDDYAGFAICRKVNEFASKAKGDFCLFFSGSGDKAFIEKKIDRIFGTHLSASKKAALITDIESMKTAGFVDATTAFHDAMKNTMDIFFAENSVGRTIAEMDIPVGLTPTMQLAMDGAKSVVSLRLNYELSQAKNGAPLLLRNKAKIELFDAIAIEVVGSVVGGVVVKAGSKAFKVLRSFFKKYEFNFKKNKISRGDKKVNNDSIANATDKIKVNSDTVLSGHGAYNKIHGKTVVPEGTSISFYSKHGAVISDDLGNAIELGDDVSHVYKRTYKSGDIVHNYVLQDGPDLNIKGNPITVNKDTPLGDILKPNMGECHWAACTYDPNKNLGSEMYDVNGIIDTEQKVWIKEYKK